MTPIRRIFLAILVVLVQQNRHVVVAGNCCAAHHLQRTMPRDKAPLVVPRPLAIPRGRASDSALASKPFVVSVETTAKLCSAFLAFNGVSILAFPRQVMNDMYKIEDYQPDEVSMHLLRTLGSLSLGTSLHITGTLLWKLPVKKAVALSLLPRLGWGILTAGKQPDPYNLLLLLGASMSLWTDRLQPALWVGILLAFRLITAGLLMTNVEASVQKHKGVDLSSASSNNMNNNKTRALFRALANELATSVLLITLSLFFHVDSAKAAGWTCVLWVVLLADMAFFDQTWKLMGAAGPTAQLIHMAISTFFALGFLQPCWMREK
jgi:hypothetical protein